MAVEDVASCNHQRDSALSQTKAQGNQPMQNQYSTKVSLYRTMSKEIKMLNRRWEEIRVALFAVAVLTLGAALISVCTPEQEMAESPAHTTFDQVTGSWWPASDNMKNQ